MQALVDDMLRYTEVCAARPALSAVNAKECALKAASDLTDLIDRSGGRVDVGDLPQVAADPRQMYLLFRNLIENAVKFCDPAEVPVVRISAANAGGASGGGSWCAITVEDNGTGFDPENAERIFGVFERLHTTPDVPGSGLGLAMCRRIARHHGGDIHAESNPGRGSRFVVTLPESAEIPGAHDERKAA